MLLCTIYTCFLSDRALILEEGNVLIVVDANHMVFNNSICLFMVS